MVPPRPHRVFIGWDSQQQLAYEVCRHSILRHAASPPPDVQPIQLPMLRERGLYSRAEDPLASTEFTYSRFLVPSLAEYQGWALFMDSDFLVTDDIASLFACADPRYAVLCVQHDYHPSESRKMDGALQTNYPRKNWSSLVLWNCEHPANRCITPELVSRETGAFLHRFHWLEDALIGRLPETWNWLEGWNAVPDQGLPKGIHFTRGGPWFEDWGDVQYGDHWRNEESLLRQTDPDRPNQLRGAVASHALRT